MIVRCKIVEGDRGAVSRENRGRFPGRTGGGRGFEAGEQGREAGSIRGREAGAEIKRAIIFFITGYYLVKNTYLEKVLKFPFNIH